MSDSKRANRLFAIGAFGVLAVVLAARGLVAIASGEFISTAKYGGVTHATGNGATLWGIFYLCLSLCVAAGMVGILTAPRRRLMFTLLSLGVAGAAIAAVTAFN